MPLLLENIPVHSHRKPAGLSDTCNSAGMLLALYLSVHLQVYYNNVLSLPLIGLLMWWFGEVTSLRKEEALQNPCF